MWYRDESDFDDDYSYSRYSYSRQISIDDIVSKLCEYQDAITSVVKLKEYIQQYPSYAQQLIHPILNYADEYNRIIKEDSDLKTLLELFPDNIEVFGSTVAEGLKVVEKVERLRPIEVTAGALSTAKDGQILGRDETQNIASFLDRITVSRLARTCKNATLKRKTEADESLPNKKLRM